MNIILARPLFVALGSGAIAMALWGCAPSAAVDAQALAPAASASAAPAALATGSIRMTLRLAPGGAELLSRVETDEPVNRRDPHRNEPTFFRVLDGQGRVLAERGFKLVTALRSEAPSADGTLSGVQIPIDAPVVSIQVPRFADASAVRLYRRDPAAPNAEPALLAEVKP